MEINEIYNEDCLRTMGHMPKNFIDLTVTSPPYDNLRNYKNRIDKSWNESVWQPIVKELYRVTKIGGIVVWVVGDATINGSETGTSFRQALYFMEVGFNLHDTMIYYRQSPFPSNVRYNQCFEYMFVFSKGTPNTFNPSVRQLKSSKSFTKNVSSKTYRNRNGETENPDENAIKRITLAQSDELKTADNIWYIPSGYMVGSKDKESFEHPATFPERLAEDHILSWSNPGDLVYDPFAGSGTTLKMAKLNRRNYIGSEISSEYCDIMRRRLEVIIAPVF